MHSSMPQLYQAAALYAILGIGVALLCKYTFIKTVYKVYDTGDPLPIGIARTLHFTKFLLLCSGHVASPMGES